ncbi:MAG: YneF family protein [Mollicutes bacterium PWAP]|nr:YneF family protein [Mollicutes bacterium PWAP]
MGTGVIIGMSFGIGIACLIIGAAIAFFITKKMFEKQMRENPPVNEDMIRAMFLQMGRKPSEAQIKNVMRSMNNAKKKKK